MSFEFAGLIGNNFAGKSGQLSRLPDMIRFTKSMRGFSFRRFPMAARVHRVVHGLVFWALLGGLLLAPAAPTALSLAIGGDVTDSTATTTAAATASAISQSLRNVLEGAAPVGVTDL